MILSVPDSSIADNLNDVSNGTVEPIAAAGTFAVIGFGEPFAAGLIPGTTYYWRVDGINDAEPDSPWKGSIWSFSVRPKIAWHPAPAKAVSPAPWAAGSPPPTSPMPSDGSG